MKRIVGIVFCGALLLAGIFAHSSTLKSDETVVLYPALARKVSEGWELQLHGIVYELQRNAFMTGVARRLLGIDGTNFTPAEARIFTERSRLFLVDNERRKKLRAIVGDETLALGSSSANGHFSSRQVVKSFDGLPPDRLTNGTLSVMVAINSTDGVRLPLEVHLLTEMGVSVISDIDDTIKISDVLDKDALLKNTFLRPFQPVSGMADVYRSWAASTGAQFHYVSASPWQLYLPLSEFTRSNGFPAGTFHMKQFRAKDTSVLKLFASPERYKPGVIEPLLRQFPKRQFVLVGDSGEKDPEIYAALARKFPGQVRKILIRDVTNEAWDSPRYQRIFGSLPKDVWRVFKHPDEIGNALGTNSAAPKAK